MLSKIDLLPVLDDFDPERAEHYLRNLASTAPVVRASSKTGDGVHLWIKWLHDQVGLRRAATSVAAPAADSHRHAHAQEHHEDPGRQHASSDRD
jgi:hydrogenase nickel incorporation protein HypB